MIHRVICRIPMERVELFVGQKIGRQQGMTPTKPHEAKGMLEFGDASGHLSLCNLCRIPMERVVLFVGQKIDRQQGTTPTKPHEAKRNARNSHATTNEYPQNMHRSMTSYAAQHRLHHRNTFRRSKYPKATKKDAY